MIQVTKKTIQLFPETKRYFLSIFFFSIIINLLMLCPAWYMLQIYDRVLTTYDENTLLGLSLITLFLFVTYALIEKYRSHLLDGIAKVFEARVYQDFRFDMPSIRQKAINFDQLPEHIRIIKEHLSGAGIISLLDSPWIAIYLTTIYLLHPSLGLLVFASVIFITALSYWERHKTIKAVTESQNQKNETFSFLVRIKNNIERISTMRLSDNFKKIFLQRYVGKIDSLNHLSNLRINLSSITRFLKITIQSSILGWGSYLAIHGEITAGMIIAASILSARSLSPLENLINSSKNIESVRSSLDALLNHIASSNNRSESSGTLTIKNSIALVNGSYHPMRINRPIIQEVNIKIKLPSSVAIIGPNGSGKTTLLKLLAGILEPSSGEYLIDDMKFHQGNRHLMNTKFGYLGHAHDLIPGTFAENIANFETQIDHKKVRELSETLKLENLIASFEDNYFSFSADGFSHLSEGQKKKIGIASILYHDPDIIFLDEPTSNLDEESTRIALKLLQSLKNRGKTLIFSTHHILLANLADEIIILSNGEVKAAGNSKAILDQMQKSTNPQ
jgi:PrtD family type I secretion system ABC transporter